ncbi:MAG: helix-turn-helix domain-containing protein [Bacteroidota bacterium]|nr:helix-turn-helix domain-containing protein [Bacteroidota bacterium]
MAFSKSGLYEKDYQLLSGIGRAFSHSARLQIMDHLGVEGICSVEELHRNHHISQGSFSDHLKILREAHLVEWEERYPYTYYWLHEENFLFAKKMLMEYLGRVIPGKKSKKKNGKRKGI